MTTSQYRFKAVVDWIEVEIQTITPSNFNSIRKHGDFDFVCALNAGSGGAATQFSFRIQNPASWDELIRTLSNLARSHPFVSVPRIIAIEIALDAYSNDATEQNLASMAACYYMLSSRHVSDNQRLYHASRGSPKAIPEHRESLERNLGDGYQIGIGNTTDDRYQHIYVKTHDNRTNLRPEQHRARTEITLRNEALPCSTSEEWASFKFERLQKPTGENLFRFRKPKPNLNPLLQMIVERKCVGVRKQRWRVRTDHTGYAGSRLYPKGTMADTTLNERVRDALRGLSRRWKTKYV